MASEEELALVAFIIIILAFSLTQNISPTSVIPEIGFVSVLFCAFLLGFIVEKNEVYSIALFRGRAAIILPFILIGIAFVAINAAGIVSLEDNLWTLVMLMAFLIVWFLGIAMKRYLFKKRRVV